MRLSGRFRIGAIVAAAVAVFLVVWLVLASGDDSPQRGAPTAASPAELREIARATDHAVYWAGARPGFDYEATRTDGGSVYVRYLPEGTPVGDRRPNFLTVATYSQRNGFTAVSEAAKEPGTVERELPGGGLAVYNRGRPTSVFFSYPRARYQVEVFDPTPGRALELVTSDRIVPLR
jgi:hypothetical protein